MGEEWCSIENTIKAELWIIIKPSNFLLVHKILLNEIMKSIILYNRAFSITLMSGLRKRTHVSPRILSFDRGIWCEILEKGRSYCRLASGRILFVLNCSILGSICTNSRLSDLNWSRLCQVELRSICISSTIFYPHLGLFLKKRLILEELEGGIMRRISPIIWFQILNQTYMFSIIQFVTILKRINIFLSSWWQNVAICTSRIDLLILKCYSVILKAISLNCLIIYVNVCVFFFQRDPLRFWWLRCKDLESWAVSYSFDTSGRHNWVIILSFDIFLSIVRNFPSNNFFIVLVTN